MKIVNTIIVILILSGGSLLAQNAIPAGQSLPDSSGQSLFGRFFLTGNGFISYQKSINQNNSSWFPALYPILIAKFSNKLFFESELAIEQSEGKTNIEMEYATLHFILNKFFSIGAGKFLSPFGTYQERLHPTWVNKFSEVPLGFSHDGVMVGPMSEVGIETRGGSPFGSSKINYAVYLSNGPALNTTTTDSMMTGMLEYGNFIDNNKNKALGGRIGFLPFSNSSLELGFSRQNAKVGDEKDSLYKNAKAAMHGFDLNYVKSIPHLKGILDMKGQYNHVMIDKTNKGNSSMDSMNTSSGMYDISQAYYVQIAFRPAFVKNKIIQKMELAGRFSAIHTSEKGMLNDNKNQISVGLNYWFGWRTVLKLDYQFLKTKGGENESAFLVQLAVAHPKIKFKKTKEENK